MDPDMVRQQEEAEAAARLHASQQHKLIPPLAEPEAPLQSDPLLILESSAQPKMRAPQAELDYIAQTAVPGNVEARKESELAAPRQFAMFGGITHSPAAELSTESLPAPPTSRRIGGWSAAFLNAALIAVGIAGGILTAAKLQFAATQGIAIGAAAGFVLGWLGAAGWLIGQGMLPGSSIRAPLLVSAFVLLDELCALLVSSSFANLQNIVVVYPEIMVAGGILAYALALIGIRARVQR